MISDVCNAKYARIAAVLDSGTAIAKGSSLKRANRIVNTAAPIRLYPMPTGKLSVNGPENINADKLKTFAIIPIGVTIAAVISLIILVLEWLSSE